MRFIWQSSISVAQNVYSTEQIGILE